MALKGPAEPPKERLSAEAIMAQLKAGEGNQKELVDQLITACQPLVLARAHRQLGDHHLAEDATAEVLLRISRKWHTFDGSKGNVNGWISTITRNYCYNFGKTKQNHIRRRSEDSEDILSKTIDYRTDEKAPSEYTDHDRKLVAEALVELESSFTPKCMKIFKLTAIENKSPKEVATTLGVSVGAVYTNKSRVLAALRERVAEKRTEQGMTAL
ncbi:MAG: sigma-70 family RNA polymerase sigma factor [Rickettsiales bacterium]|nr:sigma-70 family RNA polymerase sigma factor [Rickettsiales bacterium]